MSSYHNNQGNRNFNRNSQSRQNSYERYERSSSSSEQRRSRSRSRSPPSSSTTTTRRKYENSNTYSNNSMISSLIQQQQQKELSSSSSNNNNNNENSIPPLASLSSSTTAGPVTTTVIPNLMQAAQEKINRELFVGNTPPNTSELLLQQFLNGAMKRVGLWDVEKNGDGINENPIIHCRVNSKFAFVECTSIETANKVLNLNGIPFMGSCLKVSRPSKYVGPHTPGVQTWQQLTGQPVPPNVSPLTETSAEDKINRELFVGNTTPEMTEHMIIDFLGKAMEQVGLSKSPGNPIVACRLSGKFAFVELRTVEEACSALNLNNIPFMGIQLRVGRPSKYTGVHTPHGNWEDILSKYLSGELKVASDGASAIPSITTTTTTANKESKIVELQNMLTIEDLENDQEYKEILEDTREECGSFGTLKSVVIPRTGDGRTKIFLEYESVQDAEKAIAALKGKTFDGRRVAAMFFNEEKFRNEDYS